MIEQRKSINYAKFTQDAKERQISQQERNLLGDEENLISLDEGPSVREESSRSSINYGFYQNADHVIRDDQSQFNRGSIQSNFESFEKLRTPISRHTFDTQIQLRSHTFKSGQG